MTKNDIIKAKLEKLSKFERNTNLTLEAIRKERIELLKQLGKFK